MTSVNISNSVTSISEYAFGGCSHLTSVTIPSSVKSIGNHAFNGCRGLTSVTIPNSVTSISEYAFQNCSGLTSVTIPNSVTSIGKSAFKGCSGLTSVTIPNSVTSISEQTFEGCSHLTSVTIPNSVTSIGESAFSGCNGLTSVTIPKSVRVIYKNGFKGCTSLKNVYCYIESVPNTSASAFLLASLSTATLHVPTRALMDYKNIAPWSNFGIIVALTEKETAISEVKSAPVLIQGNNGVLTITKEGNAEVTHIKVYNMAGKMVCSSSIDNGTETIDTQMNSGDIAIVKIGEKIVKVVIR